MGAGGPGTISVDDLKNNPPYNNLTAPFDVTGDSRVIDPNSPEGQAITQGFRLANLDSSRIFPIGSPRDPYSIFSYFESLLKPQQQQSAPSAGGQATPAAVQISDVWLWIGVAVLFLLLVD